MRPMFGAIGTSPCYPSTVRAVLIRRIPTGGQEVLRAGGVATRESGRGFAACRGDPAGKVYASGTLAQATPRDTSGYYSRSRTAVGCQQQPGAHAQACQDD